MPRGKKNPPSQKRDPVTHRTLQQMRESGRKKSKSNPRGTSKLDRVKRAARNAANKKVGNGKGDVGHKVPLKNAKTKAQVAALNKRGNLKVQSVKSNRGHGMSKGKPMAKAKRRT